MHVACQLCQLPFDIINSVKTSGRVQDISPKLRQLTSPTHRHADVKIISPFIHMVLLYKIYSLLSNCPFILFSFLISEAETVLVAVTVAFMWLCAH